MIYHRCCAVVWLVVWLVVDLLLDRLVDFINVATHMVGVVTIIIIVVVTVGCCFLHQRRVTQR
jgi:hypothetical protein